MTRVFINYRRADSIATAGRLFDRLAKALGRSNVFMDVDQIPPGVDFVKHLDDQVSQCEVLLVLIGRTWLSASDEEGRRRIDDPNDFVAIEIEAALHRDILVVPVLIDGAVMPTEESLPNSLRPLARRNAIELRNSQFSTDCDRLLAKIDPRSLGRRVLLGLISVASVLAVIAVTLAHFEILPTYKPASVTSLATSAYCDSLKKVLATADRRFDPLLGPQLGRNRVALIALPEWEDCAVLMETKFSSKRSYSCSRAGIQDLTSAEKLAEEAAIDLRNNCLGEKWTVSRFFLTDGKRASRIADDAGKAQVTFSPFRLATAPSWSINLEIE